MTQLELHKLLAELKSELQQLYGEQLVAVILYGSYARHESGPHSDLDVAMVLRDYRSDFEEINRTDEIAARLSLEYDMMVALIPARESNWRQKQTSFYRNLDREGVAIP